MIKEETDDNLQPLIDEIRYLRRELASLKHQLKTKDEQMSNLILINKQLLNINPK